ncbi:MAG: GDP-mannose 4,6-dehydratase, partial [Psychrosphaera sp.]|nr:GDP-mannose 4,6-dehydratase [Psychrosphaera sp.]
MNKTILLTGAAGFTGRHFIDLAVRSGYRCVALYHKEQHKAAFNTQSVEGIVADLTDKAQLKAQIGEVAPDMVVHLAAVSFVAHDDVSDIYRTNLLGTINLLDSLIELDLGLDKVLLASSGNVYGNTTQLPIHEGLAAVPANDYGVSKYAMEMAAQIRADRLPIIITRPFNYTGIGQAEHFVVPKIVAAYQRGERSIELGNLDVARDFSDVRDVVGAYLKLLQSDVKTGLFNLCSNKATSLLEIIEQLNALAGYQMQINVNPAFVRDNEIKTLYGDNQKLTD